MDPFQNVIYMYQEITKFKIVLQTNKLATIKILRQALQHHVVVKQLYKCKGEGDGPQLAASSRNTDI